MSSSNPSPSWSLRLRWALVGALLISPIFIVASDWGERGWGAAGRGPGMSDSARSAQPSNEPPSRARTQHELASDAAGSDSTRPNCDFGVALARDAVDITPETEGVVATIAVRTGDRVRAGDLLAELDTRSLRHQLEIERAALESSIARQQRAQVIAERSHSEAERRQALADVLAKEAREAARFQERQAAADLGAAEGDVAQSQARIERLESDLSRSRIRAPFAGTISKRHLDPGARVSSGTPILRLISSSHHLVRFAVEPDRLASYSIGAPLRIEAENLDSPLTATIEHIAPEIDAPSQLVFVEARLVMTGSLALPSGAIVQVTLLPASGSPTVDSCL